MNSANELAHRLPALRDLKLLRIQHLTGSRVILHFEWAGGHATATFDAIEILDSHESTPPQAPRVQLSSNEAAKLADSREWTEEALRREGYPLYWSREWLETERARLGSWRAIAAEQGVSEMTVSTWARRHGLLTYTRLTTRQKQQIITQLVEEVRNGTQWPPSHIHAKQFGVSRATVERWRKAARHEAAKQEP